jgi:CMP-N,N'-diacetyllegionaminic acid synthase
MNVLGIIPARGGSKGIERKNISILGGRPLIAHTIEEALKSNLDSVIVSTEDDEIADTALRYGALVPFKRPMELALDTSNSIDVAIHGLKEMERLQNKTYEAVMYLQPTTPFRSSQDINDSIDLLHNNEKVDSVISVVDVKSNHPARMKYIEEGYLIDPDFCEIVENQNRQELRSMYIRNGAIYLTRRNSLLNKSFKGKTSLAHVMSYYDSINIDSPNDYEFAKWIYENKRNN